MSLTKMKNPSVGGKGRCKGICHEYRTQSWGGRTSPYSLGYRRCNVCEIYIKTEKIRCPCCSSQLKKLPKNQKAKEKIRNLKMQHIS